MVKYTYDAWGVPSKVLGLSLDQTRIEEATLLKIYNPFLYKGYYYDKETNLYYCNSRYYNPEWGRWLNADDVSYLDPSSIGGLNLYAYCGNNPISYVDPSGTSPKFWAQLASGLMIIGGAVCMFIPGAQGAGLMLIGAGVGSLVGGEISAAVGGDYLTGWAIGGVLGAFGGAYVATLPGVTSFLSSSLTLGSGGLVLAGAGTTGGAIVIATGAQIIGAGALASGMSIMFAQTSKRNGYYGERWPGDPHKPDHVNLRGNGIDIRIGRNGKPLPGEDPLSAQGKKALKNLWNEFLKLFSKW